MTYRLKILSFTIQYPIMTQRFKLKISFVLIISFFSLFAQSCDDLFDIELEQGILDLNGLPKQTEIGKGTFGFLLNGKTWLPKTNLNLVGGMTSQPMCVTKTEIVVKNENHGGIDGELEVSMPVLNAGSYQLDDEGFMPHYIDYNKGKSYACSIRDIQNSRFVITYFDSVQNIISGTFQMVMYLDTARINTGCIPLAERDQYLDFSDSIIIKDGRFDVVHR
jgi:hypothetical protein